MSLMASHWVSIDSDLVIHILYGRAVLDGGLPQVDPLLSGVTEAPVLQEWLFEVVVAWLDRHLGLMGPLLLASLLMGTLMAGLFARMRKQGVCLWIALVYVIFVLITLRIHLIIRPHLVSWAAIVVLMAWLEAWQAGRKPFVSTLWQGALLMLLWSNLHGGFLIGLALTGVFALDRGYRFARGMAGEQFLQAVALVVVYLLASFVNPWGWGLHQHLLAFLNNDFLLGSTTDFLPPIFANGSLWVLSVAGVATVLPLLARWRQVTLRDWLLLAGLGYAAATSARNIPFFGLILLSVAAGYLESWLELPGNRFGRLVLESSGRLEEDQGTRSGIGWPLLIVASSLLLLFSGTIRVGLHSQNVPEAAMDWINTHPELYSAPVFADYMFAGYLLYRTPVTKVYLHALNANYPDQRLKNYFAVEKEEADWEATLDGLSWAVVRAGEGHAETFMTSPCWQPVYSDEMADVFQRYCFNPQQSQSSADF